MFCNNCGTKIEDKDKFCSNCGKRIKNEIENKKVKRIKVWQLILIAILIIFIIVAVLIYKKINISEKPIGSNGWANNMNDLEETIDNNKEINIREDLGNNEERLLEEIYTKYPELREAEGIICTGTYDGYTEYWLLNKKGKKVYFTSLEEFEVAYKMIIDELEEEDSNEVANIKNANSYGLYDDYNYLVKSWDELIDEKIINVENGEVYVNYKYSSASKYIVGKLIIPEGIIKIGKRGFSSCKELTEVVLPESLEEIGAEAFASCENLAKINLPDGIKEIGRSAFSSCNSIKSIKLPSKISTIKDYMFAYSKGLEKVEIPNGVTDIEERAFYFCKSLKSIIIPDSVTYIRTGGIWKL